MALTVKDFKELSTTKNFMLIAGENGLNKAIRKVNILDFEYVESVEEPTEPDGLFDADALVLTSLLYAKDDPNKILPGFKQLFVDGISAIAVKTVYFKQLPKEVLEYAKLKKIPIFFFQGVEFENIIVEIMRAVEEQSRIESLEEKVENLIQPGLTVENKYRLIRHLFPDLAPSYLCFYYAPKNSYLLPRYERLITKLRSHAAKGNFYLPYRLGVLVVAEEERAGTLAVDINEADHYLGCSSAHRSLEQLPYALLESINAAKYAKRFDKTSANFDEMGVWQIILPNKDNYWMNTYCRSVLQKLKNFETDGSGELYRTIEIYVKNDFDSAKTAKEMSLHKNSIRYRVAKAKEILGFNDDPSQFRQAIYFAVKFSSSI